MRTSNLSLLVGASLLAGCGTKYIADLDPQELASSDGGVSSSDDSDPGQTVTSAGVETGGSSDESGAAIECEPDPEATCGPPIDEELLVITAPPPPIGGLSNPDHSEYDCTVAELEFQPGVARIILDCGLENLVDVSTGIEQVTYDKLAIDQAVHVTFDTPFDGNGQSMILSVDDAPLVIVMWGNTIDPNPGTDVFAPFTVVAETDVCLASCDVEDGQCYSYERQQLSFSYDGEPLATLWSQSEETVTVAGTDYRITAMAQGAVNVNPESWCADLPGYDGYAFRIADVTP